MPNIPNIPFGLIQTGVAVATGLVIVSAGLSYSLVTGLLYILCNLILLLIYKITSFSF